MLSLSSKLGRGGALRLLGDDPIAEPALADEESSASQPGEEGEEVTGRAAIRLTPLDVRCREGVTRRLIAGFRGSLSRPPETGLRGS